MISTQIGPFSISKITNSASLIWPLKGPDLDGDLPIYITVAVPSLKTAKFEIGLIDFVTSIGGALLKAIVFGSSGEPDDFAGSLPECTLIVKQNGTLIFIFNGVQCVEAFDALSVLRDLILLGDAEMIPIVLAGGISTAMKAPVVGFPLGVRSITMQFEE